MCTARRAANARTACDRDARAGRRGAGRAPRTRLSARALGRDASAGHAGDGVGRTVRRCSSPTSRPPRSTSPPRRRSSSCSRELQAEMGLALVVVSHDLGVVAGIADRVLVMYAGRIVEEGPADRVFAAAGHPYTRGLLASVPRADDARPVLGGDPGNATRSDRAARRAARSTRGARSPRSVCREQRPELRVLTGGHRAACFFADEVSIGSAVARERAARGRRRWSRSSRRAVVRCARSTTCRSSLAAGETLGLVGESGSGKSTVARLVRAAARTVEGRRSASTATTSRTCRAGRCGRCAGGCRSCSRIRTRRSIRA